jgi:asparagine synthase (glutamine-hydrolysing)
MDYGLERFEQDVWMMDSPRFDLDWIFKSELHRAARAASPGLKVMLLGQGADEFAGGYSTRLDAPHAAWDDYLRQEAVPNVVHAQAQHEGGADRLWSLRHGPVAGAEGVGPYHGMMSLFARQLQHHNLWHEDRSSAWHGLEARVPFLDHRLVELLASVPAALHPRLFWRKAIVRDALRRFAPHCELSQPKIGFIDSADKSSHALMVRALLMRCYGDFRDRYLSGGAAFDPVKVDALADRVRRCGPTLWHDTGLLAQCMAVAVFEQQLRSGGAVQTGAGSRPVPVLPGVPASRWQALRADMAADPALHGDWQPDERVRLRDGVDILVPARRDASGSICVRANGVLVGDLQPASGCAWIAPFLRNLGSPATEDFTVADWMDEFDLAPATFFPVLDMLGFRGVIEPALAARVQAHEGSTGVLPTDASDTDFASFAETTT